MARLGQVRSEESFTGRGALPHRVSAELGLTGQIWFLLSTERGILPPSCHVPPALPHMGSTEDAFLPVVYSVYEALSEPSSMCLGAELAYPRLEKHKRCVTSITASFDIQRSEDAATPPPPHKPWRCTDTK